MYLMHQQALQAARDRGYHTGLQQQQPQQPLSSWCRPPDMVPQTMNIGFDEFPSMHQPAPPDVGHRQRRLLSFSQSQQPPPHGQKHFTPKLEPADDMPSVRPTAPSSQPSAVLDQARDLLKFNHNQPKYIPEEQFTRMSAKLFNCTPEHLPHDLKQNLVGLLSCGVNSIEGYIMPGCLQLTVEALVGSEQMEAMQDMSARQAVEQLLQGQNKAFWGSDAMLVSKGCMLHISLCMHSAAFAQAPAQHQSICDTIRFSAEAACQTLSAADFTYFPGAHVRQHSHPVCKECLRSQGACIRQ